MSRSFDKAQRLAVGSLTKIRPVSPKRSQPIRIGDLTAVSLRLRHVRSADATSISCVYLNCASVLRRFFIGPRGTRPIECQVIGH